MKKIILLTSIITALGFGVTLAYSHGGGLDKNGGHNCSQKSKNKGLCSGYHYHRNDNGHTH